ncbi:hypothetical protein GYMLUDRAFT_56949 [Collybiopsis luxurians FD-317 M1]|nr:hypothetical protein GYMLUDRAFT_56949 [Collybiopsis luxurians FD-317 M1]
MESGKPHNAKAMLKEIQDIVCNAISNIYQLHDIGDFGCSRTWMNCTVMDERVPPSVKLYFFIQHTSHWKCHSGHEFALPSTQWHPALKFEQWEIQKFLTLHPKTKVIDLNQYLQDFIPRNPGNGPQGARGSLPVHLESSPLCPFSSCHLV